MTLGNGIPPSAWNKGLGFVEKDVVLIKTAFGPHLNRVPETFRGNHRGPCSFTLNESVSG